MPNLTFREGDVLDVELATGGYDFISLLASLHHIPDDQRDRVLERARDALRPGGVLVALCIIALDTPLDLARAAIVTAVDVVIESVLAILRRPSVLRADEAAMPVLNPTMTGHELRALARRTLPGATVRQLFFFRTAVVYRAPLAPAPD